MTLSFVDVPGHERFVRTMLAGVGGIDAVLLVVAADESVMPQTREHFDICRLLDVRSGVIALTRCDLADETMQAVAESDVQELVAGTPLAAAPIVRVSARTGDGLDALRQALLRCGAARQRARGRRAGAAADRPRVHRQGVRHGRHRHAVDWIDRARDGTDPVARRAARVRVRGLQVHGATRGNGPRQGSASP